MRVCTIALLWQTSFHIALTPTEHITPLHLAPCGKPPTEVRTSCFFKPVAPLHHCTLPQASHMDHLPFGPLRLCALRLAPCDKPPTGVRTSCFFKLVAPSLRLALCSKPPTRVQISYFLNLLCLAPCALRSAASLGTKLQGLNLLFFKPVAPCALRSAASLPPGFKPAVF